MPDRTLPEYIENYRDQHWCREPELRVNSLSGAERFIDKVGFCLALSDFRRPGPSLFIAVCGRRDAHMPRNVQKDPEMNLAWHLKDELIRQGKVYYGKLAGNRTMFVSRRLVASFNIVFGVRRQDEEKRLTLPARKLLRALRKEWELSSGDLRLVSGVQERTAFHRALDELQKAFIVIPSDVVYSPKFTYIWSLTKTRFRDESDLPVTRDIALREIARAYLQGAGMTWRGELARVTGLRNPDAGIGNWALVDEGFATRIMPGVYCLKGFENDSNAATAI